MMDESRPLCQRALLLVMDAPGMPHTKTQPGPVAVKAGPSQVCPSRRLWKSDGRLCRWGVMVEGVSAYPNKLISTISIRFLPMDPWSSPKVWRVQGRGGVMSPWFYKPQICDLEEFGEYFNLMAVRLGQVVFMCFAGIFTGFGLNAGVFPDRQSEHNWTTSNQS